jgi:hypothetical protein
MKKIQREQGLKTHGKQGLFYGELRVCSDLMVIPNQTIFRVCNTEDYLEEEIRRKFLDLRQSMKLILICKDLFPTAFNIKDIQESCFL